MKVCLESSFKHLYDSAVEAFPNTSGRQNSTHTVRIEHVEWVPFRGLGTLFVKGLCNNEGRKNECILLFKGVVYKEGEAGGALPLAASDGSVVHMLPLSLEKDEVMVRCSCPDFRWRFSHWNGADGSLYGRRPRRYEASFRPGSSNPEESPGLCKHLMKMAKMLGDAGLTVAHKRKFRRKTTT